MCSRQYSKAVYMTSAVLLTLPYSENKGISLNMSKRTD